MGALVTLELPADSPVRDLPWIITIGPLADDAEWEPVVCGPYERPHALALAESVVADEDLMAVVEPLLPLTSADAIRAELAAAQAAPVDDEPPGDGTGDPDEPPRHVVAATPPDEAEVRAGLARIAAALIGGSTPPA